MTREEAIELINDVMTDAVYRILSEEKEALQMAIKALEQEQKSGKWLITPMSNIAHCSECDYLFKDIPASVVEHFKYCPNCGCRMVATQEREG